MWWGEQSGDDTCRVCVGYRQTSFISMNNETVHILRPEFGVQLWCLVFLLSEPEALDLTIPILWVSGWFFVMKRSVPKPRIHVSQAIFTTVIFSIAILNIKPHYSSCLLSHTLQFGVLSATMNHGAVIWHTEQNHMWVSLWKEFCVENYFICKHMGENIAEKLQDNNSYSNNCYTE